MRATRSPRVTTAAAEVEFNGAVEVTGVDGPVPFVDLFQGHDELVVYKHTWSDGAPFQEQCEGCTTTPGT